MAENSVFKIKFQERKEVVDSLIEKSTPNRNFFLMMVLAVIITTLGLLADNSSVIIGGMLVAPILSPILCVALGVVLADSKLIYRSLKIIIKVLVLTFIFSTLITLFNPLKTINQEIIYRIGPSLIYLYIALASGVAAAFAWARPKMSEMLPGVAISVALLPPLSAVGIGIATFDYVVLIGALELFLINAAGIILASVVVFSLMGLYPQRTEAKKELAKEEKELSKTQTS